MAIQRIRPEVERTRHAVGWILTVAALALGARLTWLEIGAGRVTGTALVLFAMLGGLFYVGRRLLRPRDMFEIDVMRRTYSVIRDGARQEPRPLDELGPLRVRAAVRETVSDDRRRQWTVYEVAAAVHATLDLCAAKTPVKARRMMEKMARAWKLPCQSLGGAVRGPDDIDKPLHERLRDDPAARAPAELRPEWGLRIEPLSLGSAIHSTRRQWAPLGSSVAILGVAVFMLARASSAGALPDVHTDEPFGQVLLGLMAVALLAVLGLVGRGIRDTFFPGTVRVTDQGVSYRGSRIAFRQIEEVTATVPIEVIGDRRRLVLGSTFCPPGGTEALAHELQRLILEVAEANPHSR